MANMLPTMLRWYREHAELTQAEVAEKLDVPRSTYASWEKGRKNPGPVDVAACAQLFHVTTDDLIFGFNGRPQ